MCEVTLKTFSALLRLVLSASNICACADYVELLNAGAVFESHYKHVPVFERFDFVSKHAYSTVSASAQRLAQRLTKTQNSFCS